MSSVSKKVAASAQQGEVPFFELSTQARLLAPELLASLETVIRSGQYILGPNVEQLEEEIAIATRCRYAVGVSSGTDALLLSLMALEVGPGATVITPAYSFIATAGVISRLGATPHFVDIEPRTFTLDIAKLRTQLATSERLRRSTKAIIPVHLFGQCADMNALLAIREEFGIPVIEDAAQAFGATYPTTTATLPAGSMGLAGCFSFFPTKNLGGIGDGGMIVTNEQDFADRLRLLRNHGASKKYYHTAIGGNFRLDEIQAAVLRIKLTHLERWNMLRRQHAGRYTSALRNVVDVPIAVYGEQHHSYNQYVIRVPQLRDALREFLIQNGIGCEVYYPYPFHQQPCFPSPGEQLEESERAAAETLALPIFPELTPQMQSRVTDTILEFLQ